MSLGASLAQDRGRMQAKLEALDQEVSQLNSDNSQLRDQLRVQHKLCEDHNDSIVQLKQVCYHGYCDSISYLLLGTGYKGSPDPAGTGGMSATGN